MNLFQGDQSQEGWLILSLDPHCTQTETTSLYYMFQDKIGMCSWWNSCNTWHQWVLCSTLRAFVKQYLSFLGGDTRVYIAQAGFERNKPVYTLKYWLRLHALRTGLCSTTILRYILLLSQVAWDSLKFAVYSRMMLVFDLSVSPHFWDYRHVVHHDNTTQVPLFLKSA